jgi:4-amino-4-deoxychorismate lyase
MGRYFLDNDQIVDKASISIDHPALLNGDGVFTTLIIKEGRIEFLDLHLERLKKHAAFLNISFEKISKKLLSSFVIKTGADRGIWKCKIVLIPDKPYLQSSKRSSRYLAFLEPIELKTGPLSLCVYPEEISGPLSRIKTLSYIERHYLVGYAIDKGFDETLLCYKGFITEAAFANFFWIEKDTLFYPPKTLPYLFGITLSQVIEAAKTIGLNVREKNISIGQLSPDCHCFLSNALMGFCSVIQIESTSFSREKGLESSLKDAYDSLALQKALLIGAK